MSRRDSTAAAGAAVQRALSACMGPGAAEQLAVAQVRLAWAELMEESRLARPPLWSRVARVTGGTAHVEVSDAILAQELSLRRDAIVWSLNQRMKGRPGATIALLGLAVSVGRGGTATSL